MIQPVEIAVVQPARERDEGVRRGSYKKRDRQRGDKRAVSHFQIRDLGLGGMGPPLSSCPHLKTETLGSPLYLETMALVLWIIRIRSSTRLRSTFRQRPHRSFLV